MTGPFVGGRGIAQEVGAAIAETDGWDYFKKEFMPALVADSFRPEDQLLIEIYKISQTVEGRKVIAWLHQLTDLAPYPQFIGSIEQTALMAAKHQGRAGVGHVLAKAVAEGERLFNQQKG